MKNLIALLAVLFVLSAASCSNANSAKKNVADNIADTAAAKYVCMPCGRSCDTTVYDEPGTCKSCMMNLVDKATVSSKNIAPQSVCDFITKKGRENIILLDVRTPEEFAAGHIPNAINLNYNASDFTEQVNKLDKSKTYLVYCKAGSRSAGAANIMSTNGFNTIYNLKGGIMAWPNPLEK